MRAPERLSDVSHRGRIPRPAPRRLDPLRVQLARDLANDGQDVGRMLVAFWALQDAPFERCINAS